VPDVVNVVRLVLPLLAILAPLQAEAQLPVADLRASHTVLTEVPTLRPNDLVPLAPEYPQVVRLRIENLGPADVPDANVQPAAFLSVLTPQFVAIDVPPDCGIALTTGTTYTIDWNIGLLRAGESRECDLTFRSTGTGPSLPPGAAGTVFLTPTSSLVRPPQNFLNFASTARRFTIAPTVAVLADYSVRFEPSAVRVDPSTSRDVSLLITNRGPQAITAAQTRFYGWLERYNLFGPNPEQLDPFRLVPLGPPGCQLVDIGPVISPPAFTELTAIIDPPIAPGETRECRIRVEARPNATGERTLRFTQRIFYDGVVDPNLADNIATLRMIFSDPPAQPVPTASKTMLAVLALMLLLVGLASYARLR
jgi:hypothetical protein